MKARKWRLDPCLMNHSVLDAQDNSIRVEGRGEVVADRNELNTTYNYRLLLLLLPILTLRIKS